MRLFITHAGVRIDPTLPTPLKLEPHGLMFLGAFFFFFYVRMDWSECASRRNNIDIKTQEARRKARWFIFKVRSRGGVKLWVVKRFLKYKQRIFEHRCWIGQSVNVQVEFVTAAWIGLWALSLLELAYVYSIKIKRLRLFCWLLMNNGHRWFLKVKLFPQC